MFAQDPITSWVEEHFECGERRLLQGELLTHLPWPERGWFVACKECGGLGGVHAQAPRATAATIAEVKHHPDCETDFLFEVLQAQAA